jgi:cAMP phosphodiesterase
MPLRVQLLPTAPADRSQTQPLTSFLINDHIALDAGSFGFALSADQMADVHHVILTHTHLDHLASLPIAIAEVYPKLRQPMRVYATPHVLDAVRKHLFNGVIWPDFSQLKLPTGQGTAMEFHPIHPRQTFTLEGLRFTAIPVNHAVPTIGLIVESEDAALAFTSDTSHTEEIWQEANRRPNLQAVFIDCSFPDEFEQLAAKSGHLTPSMVAKEAAKLTSPTAKVLCVHIKPDTREEVLAQLHAHRAKRMSPIEIGKTYTFQSTPVAQSAP